MLARAHALQERLSRRMLLVIVALLLVALVWFAALSRGAGGQEHPAAPASSPPPLPTMEPAPTAEDAAPAELVLQDDPGTGSAYDPSAWAPDTGTSPSPLSPLPPPAPTPPPTPSAAAPPPPPSPQPPSASPPSPIRSVNTRSRVSSRLSTCLRSTRLVKNQRAMLRLANAKPGQTASGCIVIRYAGGSPATVTLYGQTKGTGLDRYVDLTVLRGVVKRRSFSPDRTNYLGAGPGVVYRGTLADFPDSGARGIADPTSRRPERWTSGEAHAYRFVVALQDANAAQVLTVTQSFIWRAVAR